MKLRSLAFVGVVSISLCLATPALSQGSVPAHEALDMETLERLADFARDGTSPRITASRRDESKRDKNRTEASSLILVSVDGAPAFAYRRGNYYKVPEGEIEFVMSCRGNGVIDLSTMLWAVGDTDYNTGKIKEVGVVLEPNVDYKLRIRPYGQDLEFLMPVQWAETYPSHGLLVRVAGSARADTSFFRSLRGTTNFSYQLKKEGRFTPLSGGLNFSTFRSDIAPLLEHCRAGNSNPMDDLDLDQIAAHATITEPRKTAADVNLGFLSQAEARTFRRIYEGDRPSETASRRVRMLTYFGFHIAYWEQCKESASEPMPFYVTTPLSKIRIIGVLEDDYAPFVVGASAYSQVSREIYDGEVSNDFPFRVVTQRFDDVLEKRVNAWKRVFSNHGCSGDAFNAFRKGVRGQFPWLEYQEKSRNVVVDFGGQSLDVKLEAPVNIGLTRKVGAAEAASADDNIFTKSYPGLVLRSIAIGNFELADRVEDKFIKQASNPFGGNSDNPMSEWLGSMMHLESSMTRQANIIAAYALGRTQILGACGDAVTPYSQDRVYWTEYTNGLGQYISSSPETRTTDHALVLNKFDSVVRRQSSITTSDFLSREMATIIGKLSCESPIRLRLEDNLIAYFNGSAPAHVQSLPNAQRQ